MLPDISWMWLVVSLISCFLCIICSFKKKSQFCSIMCLLPLVSVFFHLPKPKSFISICGKIMIKLIVRKVKFLSLWSNCIILDSHSQGLASLSFPVCVPNLLFLVLRKDIAVFRLASLTEIFLVVVFCFVFSLKVVIKHIFCDCSWSVFWNSFPFP